MRWLLIAVAAAVTGCGLDSALGLAPSGGTPALMTRVGISKEGGGYKIQFSLQDKDLEDTRADGTLLIRMVDYSDTTQVYYEAIKTIKKDDFKKYKTLLGGEVWGYVTIVPAQDVPKYGSDTFARMKLRFLAKSVENYFEDEDTVFL